MAYNETERRMNLGENPKLVDWEAVDKQCGEPVGVDVATLPIYCTMTSASELVMEIGPDGKATFNWPLVREIAAAWDGQEYDPVTAACALVWAAANPGVKP